MEKSADAFRTISEVADDLVLPQHVLRFWETRFPQVRPLKRAGGRRYYRPADVILLKTIRQLLYDHGYTIKGVQRLLKEQGTKAVRGGATNMPLGLTADEDRNLEHGVTVAERKVVEAEPAQGEPLPDSIRAALETLAPTGDAPRMNANDVESLRDALSTVEECERILRNLHPTRN